MSDLLIKPLRSYEDRGTIRNIDNEPYAAPVWLAKELEQLKLCEIVGEVDGEKNKSEGAGQGYKLQKKGQKWVVVDNEGAQVRNFIGKRDEAEAEISRLVAAAADATSPPSADAAAVIPPAAVQPPAVQPPVEQPSDTPPQE